MSTVEEENRAELWRLNQAAIEAKQTYYDSLLAGNAVAAQALYARWQDLLLAYQEARNAGEHVIKLQ